MGLFLFGLGLQLGTRIRAGIRTGIDMSKLSGLDMGHGNSKPDLTCRGMGLALYTGHDP
jgi:hypothetical protein